MAVINFTQAAVIQLCSLRHQHAPYGFDDQLKFDRLLFIDLNVFIQIEFIGLISVIVFYHRTIAGITKIICVLVSRSIQLPSYISYPFIIFFKLVAYLLSALPLHSHYSCVYEERIHSPEASKPASCTALNTVEVCDQNTANVRARLKTAHIHRIDRGFEILSISWEFGCISIPRICFCIYRYMK